MKTKSLPLKLFAIVMALSCALGANAETRLRGDVTGNNEVDISDVTALIEYILTGDASSLNLSGADCTLNGEIDISDVTGLIDYVLQGQWPDEPSVTPGEYVDLGLPSGTLWATRNVGANAPEDGGYHYRWDETVPVENYDENSEDFWPAYDYKSYGLVYDLTELLPGDDAAYVNWGPSWRMPSVEQIQELCENCSLRFLELNGVNGTFITGPNGHTMFLPAAGVYYGVFWSGGGMYCAYWSRSLDVSNQTDAYSTRFVDDYDSDEFDVFDYWTDRRTLGKSVRPVRVP